MRAGGCRLCDGDVMSVIERCSGGAEAARTSFPQVAIAARLIPPAAETVVMVVLWGFIANYSFSLIDSSNKIVKISG